MSINRIIQFTETITSHTSSLVMVRIKHCQHISHQFFNLVISKIAVVINDNLKTKLNLYNIFIKLIYILHTL